MYFIVAAPYEQCFSLFFKDELGYPNFYRLSELFPSQEDGFNQLVLLAPDQNNRQLLDKISAQANSTGLKYCTFGDANLSTAFTFNPGGNLQVEPQFKDALHHALATFLNQNTKAS